MPIAKIVYPIITLLISIIYCITKKDKTVWLLIFSVAITIPMMLLLPMGLDSIILCSILGILYICSYNDMQHRKIDDISILILLVLCFIYSICSSDIVLSIIRFLSVSIIMLILISLNLIHMGGGDIKLLCAIVPLLNIPEYLLMLFISSITAIIGYGIVTMVKKPKRYTIPFALYISIGAYCSKLISIFSVEHILP